MQNGIQTDHPIIRIVRSVVDQITAAQWLLRAQADFHLRMPLFTVIKTFSKFIDLRYALMVAWTRTIGM